MFVASIFIRIKQLTWSNFSNWRSDSTVVVIDVEVKVVDAILEVVAGAAA